MAISSMYAVPTDVTTTPSCTSIRMARSGEEPIRKQISVDLYYTGLTQTATLCEQDGKARKVRIDDRHKALIDIEVPAKSQTWFVIR